MYHRFDLGEKVALDYPESAGCFGYVIGITFAIHTSPQYHIRRADGGAITVCELELRSLEDTDGTDENPT